MKLVRPLLAACACITLAACNDPLDEIRSKGFTLLVPPAENHGPGNFVYSRAGGEPKNQSISLGYICDPKFTRQIASDPVISATEKKTAVSTVGASAEVSLDSLSRIGLNLDGKVVRKVSASFSNVFIEEYPLETLYQLQSKLGPICKEILQAQIKKGNAYQVALSLKADVTYRIEYQANANATTKAKVAENIQGKLGAGATATGDDITIGRGLYYGVVLKDLASP